MEAPKNGKCKYGCGRNYAKGRYECEACRSKFRRLAKKQKDQEQPSECDLLKLEIARLNQVALERESVLDSVRGFLNDCILEKKVLQDKHDVLAQALVDKDALRVERDACDKRYKELLEKHLHLEISMQKSRRSSFTESDLNSSLASFEALTLSPESKKKRPKPEECKDCGCRIYKKGRKADNVEYCACNA